METDGETSIKNSIDEDKRSYVFEDSAPSYIDDENLKSNGVSDAISTNDTVVQVIEEKHFHYENLQDSTIQESQYTLSIQETVSTSASKPEIILDKPDLNDESLIVEQAYVCNREVEEAVQSLCQSQEAQVTDSQDQSEEQINTQNVQFETEVIVENDLSIPSKDTENSEVICTEAQDLAKEMNQGIELNEVLRSSDNSDNIENNNCRASDEVLNKEELLDILEGNVDNLVQPLSNIQSGKEDVNDEDVISDNEDEATVAIKQLSRLQKSRKKFMVNSDGTPTPPKKRNRRIKVSDGIPATSDPLKKNKSEKSPSERASTEFYPKKTKSEKIPSETASAEPLPKKTKIENITLDGDPATFDSHKKTKDEKASSEGKLEASDPPPKKRKSEKITSDSEKNDKRAKLVDPNIATKLGPKQGELPKKNNIINNIVEDWDDDITEENEADNDKLVPENKVGKKDTSKSENQDLDSTISSSTSETPTNSTKEQKDKENSVSSSKRVIKKKIIFDPDNPDTFTKGKAPGKIKGPSDKEHKEQPPPIKLKSDRIARSESKSPSGKQQWKKPTPKRKIMSEVDKLLMDEGAAKIMYQMTPETKGKKNIKSKAELIKKLQSSAPSGPSMKFRERKKESEAKKILGNKQRGSMSGSIKSEEFDNHSADDSIIYRRHSSSSYSSSCMSPRRMSDVDSSIPPTDTQTEAAAPVDKAIEEKPNIDFLSETNSEEISKSHCLSLKEKLNHKLSQVLNTSKVDSLVAAKTSQAQTKKMKLKKGKQKNAPSTIKEKPFNSKLVTVTFESSLAEICIKDTGSKYYDVEMLSDLRGALEAVDARSDVAVTLLTADSGALGSALDLRPLLDANLERRTNRAYQLAEAARSVQWALWRHRPVVVTGAWGARTGGLAAALLALADEAALCERGLLEPAPSAPLLPGVAALTWALTASERRAISSLCLWGGALTAGEALNAGAVTRVLPPSTLPPRDALRGLAEQLARQDAQTLLTRKRLVHASRVGGTLAGALETERDALVEHWLSVRGQDALRQALC